MDCSTLLPSHSLSSSPPPSLLSSYLSVQSSPSQTFTRRLSTIYPRPLQAAFFLCRQLPQLFRIEDSSVHYSSCSLCGAIQFPTLYHCPRCHMDFPISSQSDSCSTPLHHSCSAISLPSSMPFVRAKADMQLLELALPYCAMTKKSKMNWTPTRRSLWIRTVRLCDTPRALLGCLLLLERCVGKGCLIHWYRLVLPSYNAQLSIHSLASLIVRMHALDSSIRWQTIQEGSILLSSSTSISISPSNDIISNDNDNININDNDNININDNDIINININDNTNINDNDNLHTAI